MHTDQDTEDRSVEVEAFGSPERDAKGLPVLDPRSLDALTSFLRRVWADSEKWHRLPEYGLSIRALQSQSDHQALCFETRDADSRNNVRRYRYDFGRGVLTWWNNDEVEHKLPCDLFPDEDPNPPFPLVIVAFARERPEALLTTPDHSTVSVFRHMDPPAALSVPSPLQVFVADFFRRLTAHWFGFSAPPWSRLRQWLIALTGSLTFFIMVAVFLYTRDPDWTKAFLRSKDALVQDIFVFQPTLGMGTGIFLLSSFFAWLASWGRRNPGPVRLYLGGFLLPYFVWTLLSLVDVNTLGGKTQTDTGNSRKVANVDSKG